MLGDSGIGFSTLEESIGTQILYDEPQEWIISGLLQLTIFKT